MSSHSLTNFEKQKYYQNKPNFNDFHSRNNLQKINLDESKSIETHLIALSVNTNNSIF